MHFRVVIAAGLVAMLAAPPTASANGRFPATVNTKFRPGNNQLIILPTTFGLLISSDNGASFQWICEDTIGYGGTFDPDYALTSDGRIYATTFEGLRYSDDGGCTFNTIGAPLENRWVGEVEVGANGRVWAGTSTGGMPNDVFISDDGVSFTSVGLLDADTWWRSIRVSDSDPDRVYVAGLRVATGSDAGVADPSARLLVTTDGGLNWSELATGAFEFGTQPDLFIAGVSPTDPDTVFVRVRGARQPVGDDIWRSTDGGANWTKILSMGDTISAFTVRSDGQTVMVGTVNICEGDPPDTVKGCVRISEDGGDTFTAPEYEPKMACVSERSDGDLFACASNWDPDQMALGKLNADGCWDKVMRFCEISGPLECPSGTAQNDCGQLVWPSLAEQLGIGSCAEGTDEERCGPVFTPDAGPEAPDAGTGGGGGGCGCSASPRGVGALPLLFFALIPWRRKRRA